ncbi:MAG: GNAT family N-acetyltransferase [Candidatus Sericytochromatia bacterium]
MIISDIRIKKIPKSKKFILKNLMNLYQYDFSEFDDETNIDNNSGLFNYDYIDNYWTEKSRTPFFIFYKNNLAGFALINEHTLIHKTSFKSISEFFIMRKFRKNSIGKKVAFLIFDKFKNYNFEIAITDNNKVANIFWQKVLTEYTKESFLEKKLNNRNWKGNVLYFYRNKKYVNF